MSTVKPRGLTYIFLLTLILGCATEDEPIYRVDARLEKYVDKFFHEAGLRGKSLTKGSLIISVTPDLLKNEKRIAVTRGDSGDQIVIEVDEGVVHSRDTLFLEFAMMHEFGHGFLKRAHVSSYSIMNPSRRTVDGYKRNEISRNKLLDELFL